MMDKMQIARARAALPTAVRAWIYDPNVTLVGLGFPQVEGEYDDSQVALCFHVRSKLNEGPQLESAVFSGETQGKIPKVIDGIPTDVVQANYDLHQFWTGWNTNPALANPRAREASPIQCGVGISCEALYGSGTLGGLVRDRTTGALMCLSNWHVLVSRWSAFPPLRIYQPGRLDGGDETDTFAMLTRDAMLDNLDAAVATIQGERVVVNDQIDIGPVRGVESPALGMVVTKSGYGTDVTHGKITRTDSVAKLPYDGQERLIRGVFVIDPLDTLEPVSGGGDSGSLWLDDQNDWAVGLHFAGMAQPKQALAMNIQAVLDSLGVDLVTT